MDRGPAVEDGDAGGEPVSTRTAERGMSGQAGRPPVPRRRGLSRLHRRRAGLVRRPAVADRCGHQRHRPQPAPVGTASLSLRRSAPSSRRSDGRCCSSRWAPSWPAPGLFLRLSGRTDRRWAIRLVPLGGLVGFAYFAMYLIHDRQTPLLLMQYTGVGLLDRRASRPASSSCSTSRRGRRPPPSRHRPTPGSPSGCAGPSARCWLARAPTRSSAASSASRASSGCSSSSCWRSPSRPSATTRSCS